MREHTIWTESSLVLLSLLLVAASCEPIHEPLAEFDNSLVESGNGTATAPDLYWGKDRDEVFYKDMFHNIGLYYVKGDLNADGMLTEADQSALDEYLQAGTIPHCLSAADLDSDNDIDDYDISDLANRIRLAQSSPGSYQGLVLGNSRSLGCERPSLPFATRSSAAPGERIVFLSHDDSIVFGANASLEIVEGQGVIAMDGHQATIEVGTGAADTFLTLKLDYAGKSYVHFVWVYTPSGEVYGGDDGGVAGSDDGGNQECGVDSDCPTGGGEVEVVPTPEDCPQRREKSCGLVLRMLEDDGNRWVYEDARDGLDDLSYKVAESSADDVPEPSRRVQSLYFKLRGIGGTESDDEFKARWDAVRARQRDQLMDALGEYRDCVRGQAEVGVEIFIAHGSDGDPAQGTCGYWWAGMDLWFSRCDTLQGNYDAAKGNVCGRVSLDVSCYSGHTPDAEAHANGTGNAVCYKPYQADCQERAGWEKDLSISVSDRDRTVFIHVAAAFEDIFELSIKHAEDDGHDRIYEYINPKAFAASYEDDGYSECN